MQKLGNKKENRFKGKIKQNQKNTNMTMNFEFITPEKAADLLEKNTNNRSLSYGSVSKIANDIKAGNWNPNVGSAISIDDKGILRDGQHRLWAVVESGIGIYTWVCRNVASDGIYDDTRKRSLSDQITIMKPDTKRIYRSANYVSIARWFIMELSDQNVRRAISPSEIIDFTEQHKKDLDGFFMNFHMKTARGVSISAVIIALFMAYMCEVDLEDINAFYEILCTGMSSSPEEYPIIAFRNYLLKRTYRNIEKEDIIRCQYAINRYVAKSCATKLYLPKDYIYPMPWENEQQKLDLK